MKKIVIAADSYKGCLSSERVCAAMRSGISRASPDAETKVFPSSDGGEGFCDCMKHLFGGIEISREVTFPDGRRGEAVYLLADNGKKAYIELASASGLCLVPRGKKDIMTATTFGTGELIKDAAARGAREIVVGLGGSATNDCGIGLLAALGMRFFDARGNELPPIPVSMPLISKVDEKDFIGLENIGITAACDVRNPLCGRNGAARVYAKQKGASETQIDLLELAAERLASLVGFDKAAEGAGAAGGTGFALMRFLHAEYVSGASLLVGSREFRESLKDASLVMTGEGHTDSQTGEGKLVNEIALAAKENRVPVAVLSGGISGDIRNLYSNGVTAVFSICKAPSALGYCIENASALITDAAENIMRLLSY